MKNLRTPRTLAECEFTSGYSIATPRQRGLDHPWIFCAILILLCAVGVWVSA